MIDNDEVVRLSVVFIWLLGSMQPLMAIEFSLGGALRGAGDTKTPLVITLTCLLFIRVSLALIFYMLDASIEVIFSTLVADYVGRCLARSFRAICALFQSFNSGALNFFAFKLLIITSNSPFNFSLSLSP